MYGLFRLLEKKRFEYKGYAMIIFYLVSLNKPEFTQFAKELAPKTTKDSCLAIAWILSRHRTFSHSEEYSKIVNFLHDHCKRSKCGVTKWAEIQRQVRNLFHLQSRYFTRIVSNVTFIRI